MTSRSSSKQPRAPSLPPELGTLGRSLRNLIDTALRAGAAGPELSAVAAEVDALEARLRPFRSDPPNPRIGAVGNHNPINPLPRSRHDEGVTRGEVRFGIAHQGPPGSVHGGHIALLFDQILGQHIVAAGSGGMTGRLELRYARPSPIDTELAFEVHTVRATRRWIRARGELRDASGTLASAEGLFARPMRRMRRRGDAP